jgi:hypothetical protein
MVKPKNAVKKISDKLNKVNDSFTINMYDNGFMMEIGGRDHEDNWTQSKIMVTSLEELNALMKEASEMDRE